MQNKATAEQASNFMSPPITAAIYNVALVTRVTT